MSCRPKSLVLNVKGGYIDWYPEEFCSLSKDRLGPTILSLCVGSFCDGMCRQRFLNHSSNYPTKGIQADVLEWPFSVYSFTIVSERNQCSWKIKKFKKKTEKGILWDCHRIHLTASLCCNWPPIPVYKPQWLWNLQAQHPFHFQFNTKSLFLHLSKLLAFSELVCQYVVTVCFLLFVHTTFALLYQIFHFLPLENSFSPSEGGDGHTHTHTLFLVTSVKVV